MEDVRLLLQEGVHPRLQRHGGLRRLRELQLLPVGLVLELVRARLLSFWCLKMPKDQLQSSALVSLKERVPFCTQIERQPSGANHLL